MDKDMNAVNEVTAATTEFQGSMTQLQALCVG